MNKNPFKMLALDDRGLVMVGEDDEPCPEYALMTIEEFVTSVKFGAYNDDDGSGVFSNGKDVFDDEHVDLSKLVEDGEMESLVFRGFTHVAWYGK